MVKAVEKAYGVLRAGIIEGRFPPHSRVTEQEIVEASGVSRTPVREAMRRLQAEGLLRFVPHQGAFVTAWSDENADEIFELRAILESYAVERACARATTGEIAELRETAEAQHGEVVGRRAGYLERITGLNARFHQLLQQAARSERLTTLLASLADAPLVFQTFRDYTDEELLRSARHHVEIVRALEARDAGWAAAVMRSHVLAARSAFQRKHVRQAAAHAVQA